MALWQVIDTDNGRLDEQWDDGFTLQPWEDGFTVDRIVEYAGAGNFNLIGVPNWVPPESAASAQENEELDDGNG